MAGWDDVPADVAPADSDRLLCVKADNSLDLLQLDKVLQHGGFVPRLELLGDGANAAGASASLTIAVAKAGQKFALIGTYQGGTAAGAGTADMVLSVNGSEFARASVRACVIEVTTDPDTPGDPVPSYGYPPAPFLRAYVAATTGEFTFLFTAPNGPVSLVAFPLVGS